ncbi:unnamed protein product [Trichogramma brassicae]|uniref:Peptidylamidoglycolate lyase n=1 Tax=Trichogramma brassicae TaxID=86971 RepID=A0A6H5J4I2_9HYME|nr:unnamed protein product [Trichogramma brassicae]
MRMCSAKTASRAHGISYYTRSIHSGDFCSRSSRKRFSHTRDHVKFRSPYCYYYTVFITQRASCGAVAAPCTAAAKTAAYTRAIISQYKYAVLCVRPMKRLLFIEGAVRSANRISMDFFTSKNIHSRIRRPVRCRVPEEQQIINARQADGGDAYLAARQPVQDQNWKSPRGLGQISGVSVDPQGRPVVFHRGDHYPRRERFGMGELEPSLVLGERFVPGSDGQHFCQPTAVAVMPETGEIVIADGYCNDRILVLDPQGKMIGQLPPTGNEDYLRLSVPHSLTIMKRGDVCVADREHQRIVCFNLARALRPQESSNKEQIMLPWLPLTVHRPGVCRIFGVTSHDDMLYAVNGPTTSNNPVMGFTLNPDSKSILSTWGPTFDSFSNPHEIAACPNGTALYVSEIGPNIVWKFRLLTNWKM